MRKKHLRKVNELGGDNFFITEIFKYINSVYNSFSDNQKSILKQKKEEEITDYIKRALLDNEDFGLNGFIVNTEARNQSSTIGYYDLKFENSDWLNQYLVLECKPIDKTSARIDAYIHKQSFSRGENGIRFGTLTRQELLNASLPNFENSFQSDHIRICNGQIIDPILIFHLFLDFT